MSHILTPKAFLVRSGRSAVDVDRNLARPLVNPRQHRPRRGSAYRTRTHSSIASPRPMDEKVGPDVQNSYTSDDLVDSEKLMVSDNDLLSICVVGASGDLAKKKIFPSLFALYYKGYLPKNFAVWGYARSKLSFEEFRERITQNLSCRLDQGVDCGKKMEEFLDRCNYISGGYDSIPGFGALDEKMSEQEKAFEKGHRIFYLSIPPNVFVDSAQTSATAASSKSGGFTRLIVEKPFGRDSESSKELDQGLQAAWEESQIYRIDHYLGKELVDNLMVLRFSNLIFEPLWNRKYVKNVQLVFSENFGTEGRGGYFDYYGIIRDIMQNHLLQCLALVAMEPPVNLDAENVVSEKVKLLKCIEPIKPDDVVIGQYTSTVLPNGKKIPGYLDDETVPDGSVTPTYGALAMYINNTRWAGVPFLMKAGKALDKRVAEIRIQFDTVRGGIYEKIFQERPGLSAGHNELVIRIQPDEAIYMRINNKVPGLDQTIEPSTLDLQYRSRYAQKDIPDAYERLILDVIEGDKSLFIRNDELEQAWKLFTPILHHLEANQVQPKLYSYGSRGPEEAVELAARNGLEWGEWNEQEEE